MYFLEMKILSNKTYNKLIERNKELETENIRLEGNYNLCKQFEKIGDAKLEKAMQRIEGYILKIKEQKCQKCQSRAK